MRAMLKGPDVRHPGNVMNEIGGRSSVQRRRGPQTHGPCHQQRRELARCAAL